MAWSRFEPGFSRHVKRVKCGPLASWLWACSVDHCTEFRTDGFLDEAAIAGLCPAIRGAQLARCIDALVAVHSWVKTEGGYIVYGYLEHNVTAERIEKDRQAARERYQRWHDKRRDNAAATPPETPQQRDSPHGRSVGRSVDTASPLPPSNGIKPVDSRGQPRRRGRSSVGPSPEATRAWAEITGWLGTGRTILPTFADAKVPPVVAAMGGWSRITCLRNGDVARPIDFQTIGREFMRLYDVTEAVTA